MKKLISILALSLLLISQADARGRKPCSGSKGGISHCTSGGDFVCNDGSLSQSKKFCSGYGSERSQKVQAPTAVRKSQQAKIFSGKKSKPPEILEQQAPAKIEKREPTCAPLYMANKPGYTHLPICSGNQY